MGKLVRVEDSCETRIASPRHDVRDEGYYAAWHSPVPGTCGYSSEPMRKKVSDTQSTAFSALQAVIFTSVSSPDTAHSGR